MNSNIDNIDTNLDKRTFYKKYSWSIDTRMRAEVGNKRNERTQAAARDKQRLMGKSPAMSSTAQM
jgi:hypothetical protein